MSTSISPGRLSSPRLSGLNDWMLSDLVGVGELGDRVDALDVPEEVRRLHDDRGGVFLKRALQLLRIGDAVLQRDFGVDRRQVGQVGLAAPGGSADERRR